MLSDLVIRTQSGASDQSVSLCKVIVKSQAFFIFMIAVIILNTVLILLEDDSTMATSVPWLVSDCLFTGLFIFEFLIKIYVMGIAYFYDGWNTTDFMCVVLAVTGLAFRVLMFAGAMKDNIAGSEAHVHIDITCVYICVYIYIYMYMHLSLSRERERAREREKSIDR